MAERPILFSAPMVRAILDGRKTQTRRVVKWNNHAGVNLNFSGLSLDSSAPGFAELYSRDGDMRWQERANARCPYGKPGNRLWVREAWQAWTQFNHLAPRDLPKHTPNYLADGNTWDARYRHAQFMPRWASRITLEITDVRVQRLQEISEEDARAEGIDTSVTDPSPRGVAPIYPKQYGYARDCFSDIWESIKGVGSWDANPWVWALTFKRVEA